MATPTTTRSFFASVYSLFSEWGCRFSLVSSRVLSFTFSKVFALSVALLVAVPSITACLPVAITTATVTAISVSQSRRTPGTYLDDNALELKLRADIAKDAIVGRGVNISVTTFDGLVLLTGEVNSDEQRQRVSELAEVYKQTREVIFIANELELAGRTNISSRFNDAWLTTKVKTRLFKAKNLSASSVKVVTEHGKVYLLGIVTRAEDAAAVDAVRRVNGVTHIVKVLKHTD